MISKKKNSVQLFVWKNWKRVFLNVQKQHEFFFQFSIMDQIYTMRTNYAFHYCVCFFCVFNNKLQKLIIANWTRKKKLFNDGIYFVLFVLVIRCLWVRTVMDFTNRPIKLIFYSSDESFSPEDSDKCILMSLVSSVLSIVFIWMKRVIKR